MSHDLIDPKQNRQLFLDDYAIQKKVGVKQTVHPPRKCGPLIRPDRACGQSGIQSRSTPQWNSEKEIWEWWYYDQYAYYATSKDGEHWETPSLGLYEWNGSKDNNIACDPSKPRIYHIIRDENDLDPDRRYKGLFNSHNRYLATSPDGFDWTMLDVPPIPSADESHFTYDEISGQFIAMVKHSTKWGRSVWLSTSKDFAHFSKPELIFHTDEIDRENRRQRVKKVVEDPSYFTPPISDDEDYIAEAYHMAVMPYQGFYIGFPRIFNPIGAVPPPEMNFTRINQVELAVSRDLYDWGRVADRTLFMSIEPWDGVTYDTYQVSVCGRPHVREDGEIWIYYNGARMPASAELYRKHNHNRELYRLNVDPEMFNDTTALCLAKLPMDRFVSLDADQAGTITTKPFIMQGKDLYVNAEANWGEIYTEILDAETMKPFPGFWVPGNQPPPLTGDHLRKKIEWQPETDRVFEKPVRIRFYMHQARLYSFWLE